MHRLVLESGAGGCTIELIFPQRRLTMLSTIDCINTAIIFGPWKQGYSPFCKSRHQRSNSF